MTAALPKLSAIRSRLVRNPVVIDCVRAAAGFVGGVAEVVVFEDERAFIAGSSDPKGAILQPRPIQASEQRLIEANSEASEATIVDGMVSLPIGNVDQQASAALTVVVHTMKEAEVPVDGLRSLVRLIQAEVDRDRDREETADFFRRVLEGQRDAVAVLAPDMTIKWMSEAIGSLIGRTPRELIGSSPADLVHPDDLESVLDAIVRFSQGLEVYRVELRLLNAGGAYTPVEITGMDLSDDPIVGGLVLTMRDAQRSIEQDRWSERSQRMSNAIVSNLRDGVIATDEFGAIVKINETARSMFSIDSSLSPAQLAVDDFLVFTVDGRPHNPFTTHDATEPVCCIVSEDGEPKYVTTSSQPISDGLDGAPSELGRVILVSDVTSEFEASQELRTQALHDQLTGLANRRQLDERLREIATTADDINVAACFIDLDSFKLVNDVHGHGLGDNLVRIAAKRLAAQLRDTDLLVRQGGDEFVALLIGTESMAAATETAERCRRALAKPYIIDAERFDVTGSIGVAISSARDLSPTQLLQHADLALYSAKDLGRNRVESFGDELAAVVSNEAHQRKQLKQSLEEGRLAMHFQPLVDTASETTVGYEALARIQTESGSLLSPASFMDSIGSTSLMWDLDHAAFELSCKAAAMLSQLASDRQPYVACNFSSVSVNHPEFLPMLQFTVEQAGIEPSQISIELTESAALDVTRKVNRQIDEMVELGFRFALDDFGTGYSSLSHLRDLPISTLKVDRSFIVKLRKSQSERSIANAIVQLARDLEFDVVAEGVESAEHLRHARELGFTTIQGWYYSRALTVPEALEDWASSVEKRTRPLAG